MNNIDDYLITGNLVNTGFFTLYTVKHKSSEEVFLLKTFHRLDPYRIASLRSGMQLVRELNLDIILEPLEFFEQGLETSILYKHFESNSLRSLLREKKALSADYFLATAKKLAAMLSVVHSRGWILKNLCPENILINNETLLCKLADLRRATRIHKTEKTDLYEKADLLELQYISPEQTGRISQITDNRSDLYSLGVIFYEMLTGQLPFQSADPVEIIHALLALPIVEPVIVNPSIPKVLNDIVTKLIAKSPEERYQSCEGLIYDLEIAQGYLNSTDTFRLARKDRINRIVPTAKLIGRKDELEIIENTYQASKKGKKQCVYISGYSGVGKTRIVQEFYRDKIARNATMVASKFDTLQRTTPYSALVVAMKDLVRKLLKEDDERLAYWRSRFQNHLLDNAQIIIEVVPELEVIVGPQKPVNILPPDEAQKRFQQTFIRFITALTTDEHSLIIFLDDLQWADIASIRLIELILLDDSVRNFFFIGAYRENEVDPSHPLSVSLRKLDNWTNLCFIKIEPLKKDDTRELVVETLYDPVIKSEDFIDAIIQKTGGNAFFTIQMLSVLFDEHILFHTDEGVWEWNEKLLQRRNISDNVVEFLEQKMDAIDPRLKTLLVFASCLGDSFDLKTLAKLAGDKMNSVAGELSVAINLGYVISIDENLDSFFRTVSQISEEEMAIFRNARFRFSHDRIRHAALAQLNEKEMMLLNLNAARIKTKHFSESEIEDEIFFIANHFIAGEKLIDDADEMMQLVEYCRRAGMKAKNSSAYDSAVRYFEAAKRHLTFESDYENCYNVHLQQSECLYLTGKYVEAEKSLDYVYSFCRSRIDKLNTLFTKVHLYNIQDKKLEAVETGRVGYRMYNIYMPRRKSLVMVLLLKDVLMAKMKLSESRINRLLERPLMKDPELIRLQEFLLAMSPTIYQYDQNLFAWNFMRMFFASLKYGNNGISSFCYIGYGMLVSQLFGKYRMGKKLADIALQLNSHLGYTALKWKVRLTYYNFVHHWTEPIRPEIHNILEVENGAFANGDPIFAGYAIFIYHQKKFALGFHLKELEESCENYLKVVDQRHDIETRHFLESYYYAIRCLRGLESETNVMGASFNAPERLRESINSSSFTVVADTFIAYMSTLYMLGHYENAFQQCLHAAHYMDFIQQRYEFAEFNFYSVLICASAHELKFVSKEVTLKKIKTHLKKLKVWMEHCPANFEPQYLMAAAELERIRGNGQRASALYEQAIRRADEYNFINYKALANELAGKFQFKSGNQIMARTYLNNSRQAYMDWGAIAKVKQLEQEFGKILETSLLQEQPADEKNANVLEAMDLTLVLQASRALKSEKEIDSLVEQLMKVIIRSSGADSGYLLIKNRSGLVVKAHYSSSTGVQALTEDADNSMMPMSIIKYVIRLKEPIILNQPAQIPEYISSRYFETKKPRSLICYPILKQGEIFGVLYLENYLSEGVFDGKKANMLNFISDQVAVSLDNAFLSQQMESRVLERTEKLELEKGKLDEMLENMLPKAAIDELKRTGKTTAQKFENLTVLMADIVGFTTISERLTPEELIGKIDFYFSSFDDIMVKHRLEKIKTIGDAYMAVGGFHSTAEEGALNVIAAAIDMLKFVQQENSDIREEEKFELRIGIHTGTVIAGVVGFKKFQYDIWGDAVNIAARMEQQCEPNKINISKATWLLTNEKIMFTYRGMIEAKNKGPMDMYFVSRLKDLATSPNG